MPPSRRGYILVARQVLYAWFDNAAAAKKFGVAPADAKLVRERAFAFVDWLRNAEDEDDDD